LNSNLVVKVPSLGVNDNTATVVDLLHSEGDYVHTEDVVAVLETTKSTFDVETTGEGYLILLFKEGDEVDTGTALFIVVKEKQNLEKIKNDYLNSDEKGKNNDLNRITNKAKIKAEKCEVSLEDLLNTFNGIIREKEVDLFLAEHEKEKTKVEEVELVGLMDAEFIQQLTNDELFANLSSQEKVERYREHGAVIEEGVAIGKGTIIVSDYIHLMKDASVGNHCYIRTKIFRLGIMSSIGNKANMVAHTITIGDVSRFGHNVLVSGGFSIHAVLEIGDRSLISSHCLLDSGDGIEIGNEVGVSPYVKLYTHNHWQSELEGYHSNFGSIVVKDKAYITGDCIVVPGVTIGEGATVLANSTVMDDIQPRTQVCGNPAKVIGRIPAEISLEKKERTVKRIVRDMEEDFAKTKRVNEGDLLYISNLSDDTGLEGKVVLSFNVSDELDKEKINFVLFDMNDLVVYGNQNAQSDEVRNFLRRRGIRFEPIYWNYTGEKHLYND